MLQAGFSEDEFLIIAAEAKRDALKNCMTKEYEKLYYASPPDMLCRIMDAADTAKFEAKLKSYFATFNFKPDAKLIDIKEYIDCVTGRIWINEGGKFGKVGRYEIGKDGSGIHYHFLFTINKNRKPSQIIDSFWYLANKKKIIANKAGIDLKVRRKCEWGKAFSYLSKGLDNSEEFALNKSMERGGEELCEVFAVFADR